MTSSDALLDGGRPAAEIFCLCRAAEVVDGVLNITGAGSRFAIGPSSVVVPQVTAVASIRFPVAQEGTHVFEINVVDLHGEEIVAPAMGTLEVAARGDDVHAWMQFSTVVASELFRAPGDFRFDVAIDGEHLATSWLCVVRP
jgi:hypothetical protein